MSLNLLISIPNQTLRLMEGDQLLAQFPVSTAFNGAGEVAGSEKTPRGKHIIRAKIGANLPENAVLKGRRWTGEIYTPTLAAQHPKRDWILSRILWLSGLEPGKNRLGNVDSMRRYIYIHGTPDTEPMSQPRSHGCIRMRNSEVIKLFDSVPLYCPVLIE